MRTVIAMLLSLTLGAGCAHVRQEYSSYEGPNAEQLGTGGLKKTENGIDFWTAGTPPRRFQILGVLKDTRRNQRISAAWFSGDVAERVRAAGGDAVVMLDESTGYVGTFSYAEAYGRRNYASATAISMPISDKSTVMVVIRYLAAAAAR